MNEEKQTNSTSNTPSHHSNKPVVVYIMILFIAAFLLMALSSLMHQRSNTEALGQMQSSMASLREMQEFQEQIISLQEELHSSQQEAEEQSLLSEELEDNLSASQSEIDALLYLYTLQQQYLTMSYEGCQKTIDAMEASGANKLLPDAASTEGVTAPSLRYQQLKEAVAAQLAAPVP